MQLLNGLNLNTFFVHTDFSVLNQWMSSLVAVSISLISNNKHEKKDLMRESQTGGHADGLRLYLRLIDLSFKDRR